MISEHDVIRESKAIRARIREMSQQYGPIDNIASVNIDAAKQLLKLIEDALFRFSEFWSSTKIVKKTIFGLRPDRKRINKLLDEVLMPLLHYREKLIAQGIK